MVWTGKNSQVMFAKEASFGAGGTYNRDVGVVTDITESLTQTVKEDYAVGNIFVQNLCGESLATKLDMTFKIQHGKVVVGLLGDAPTETNNTSDYKHSWTTANTEESAPSLAFEVAESNGTTHALRTYVGAVMNSLTIGITPDETLNAKASFMCKNPAVATSAPATYTISTLPTMCPFKADFKIGGVSQGECQSWEATLERVTNEQRILGSRFPNSIQQDSLKVTGKVTLGFSDNDELDDIIGTSSAEPTDLSLNFLVDNGTAWGSGKKGIDLAVTNAKITDVSKPVKIDGFASVDISYVAKFSTLDFYDTVATYV